MALLNLITRKSNVVNLICLSILSFSFSCNSVDSGIELNQIKLGDKELVKDKVMLVSGFYYNFNTQNLEDGRIYRINARSTNKRNGNLREVGWEEIDKLIVFFEDKYEIELKPFGGLSKTIDAKSDPDYIPDGYKAIKNGIQYRIFDLASSIVFQRLDKFPQYRLVIEDLELIKIHEKERLLDK